jgi:hypothetical protein
MAEKASGVVEKGVVSCLEDKSVIIKFFPRPRGFVTNPKHILYGGMLEGSVKVLSTPLLRNGDYKNVLSNDEKAYLEEHMGLGKDGLSVYKKDNNYWDSVRVKLEKGENHFNLASPDDFIRAKVALAYDDIVAPSIDEIQNKQSYMFYAVKEGEREKQSVKSLTAKQEAYKLYGKYEEERDVLEYVCKAVKGTLVAKNTKMGILQGWIGDIIESNTKEFILILSDKQLRTKMLIDQAVRNSVVRFIDGQYYSDEGKPLSTSGEANLMMAANFLDQPINQPMRLRIENKIKIAE